MTSADTISTSPISIVISNVSILLLFLVVQGNDGPYPVCLCLRGLLHGSAAYRVEPRFGGLLPLYFRRGPVPAVACAVCGQDVSAAFFQYGIDDLPCRIQQAHLRHRGDVCALSVAPQVEYRFRHRRGGLPGVI